MTTAQQPTTAQRAILTDMARNEANGRYTLGYGAQWKSLEALTRKGLAELIQSGQGAGQYRLTEAGKAALR